MATANVTARAISKANAIKEVILDFARIPSQTGLACDFDLDAFDKILDRGIAKNRLVRSVVLHFWSKERIEAEVFFRINWNTMDAETKVHGPTINMPKAKSSTQSLSQRLSHLYDLVLEVASTQPYEKMSWLIYWRDEPDVRDEVNTLKAQFNLVSITQAHQGLIDDFRTSTETDDVHAIQTVRVAS